LKWNNFVPVITLPLPKLISILEVRLAKPLPGKKAHDLVRVEATPPFKFQSSSDPSIPAAVLILLFPSEAGIQFFLTERTNLVEHHKGQVSLPGGAWETGEKLKETALRETEEEIGVPRETIRLVGSLTPYYTAVTGFMVHPFVGACDSTPDASPHAQEVETLFSVTLEDLLNDRYLKKEIRTFGNHQAEIPYFQFGSHKVWGVTGAILSEFKWVLKEVLS
jgi:8-oxo-dGTP pyrophosphatase MutT (NUDIX family)